MRSTECTSSFSMQKLHTLKTYKLFTLSMLWCMTANNAKQFALKQGNAMVCSTSKLTTLVNGSHSSASEYFLQRIWYYFTHDVHE